ncbi:CrcB family protein [Streptococcus sp. sy010]|uniref:CrcB family protein n=1 Tax=Streptococcus sp. sy010 TaxID=2600148 RepID=UPI0011B51F36|nr:CrcB family protein [Streptococcus sp. sy010]TWT16520.1 camphor resistance protein CrcB [Streptococcus sp. sy010]
MVGKLMLLVGIAVFAGLGAMGRYYLSGLNQKVNLPLGTLLANLLATFVLAYTSKQFSSASYLPMLTVGLVGGLGTYSSVQVELLNRSDHHKQVITYFLLTYLGGLLMIFLGFSL